MSLTLAAIVGTAILIAGALSFGFRSGRRSAELDQAEDNLDALERDRATDDRLRRDPEYRDRVRDRFR